MNYKFLELKNGGYFSRRIVKFDSSNDYNDVCKNTCTLENFNFKDGNYLYSEITNIEWNQSFIPNYLLVEDSNFNIVSRWFITAIETLRTGRKTFTLKRDVIADNLDTLKNSTVNTTRKLIDWSNDQIFNNEGFTTSKVKTKQINLYDSTNCPWIVGYIPTNLELKTFNLVIGQDYDIDMRTSSYSDWTYSNFNKTQKELYSVEFNIFNGGNLYYKIRQYTNHAKMVNVFPSSTLMKSLVTNTVNPEQAANAFTFDLNDLTLDSDVTSTDVKNLLLYDGKKILFSDGVYLINVTSADAGLTSVTDHTKYAEPLLNELIIESSNNVKSTSAYGTNSYKYKSIVWRLDGTKITSNKTLQYQLPTTANQLSDMPYKMFCIPYGSVTLENNDVEVDVDPSLSMEIAKDLSIHLTQSELYDLQLLPYCPVEFDSTENNLTFYSFTEDTDFTYIKNSDGVSGVIFFPKTASFEFNIEKIKDESISSLLPINDLKIQSETESVRINDPQWTSAFDFNIAKNRGVDYFKISCTYQPMNPLIVVQPNFKGLYGNAFKDNRGLVCQGDYSLPKTDDTWLNYQQNNKTYQQAFNRKIENLEVTNKYQNISSGIGAGIGTLTGAAGGLMLGNTIGGTVGSVVGAGVGAVASLAGGIADYAIQKQIQQEQINYAKDSFNFQLANIQAMPNTLAKTSSINCLSTYVPTIEVYEATAEEISYLKSYFDRYGYKVNIIEKLNTQGPITATLLDSSVSATYWQEINSELNKGVIFE